MRSIVINALVSAVMLFLLCPGWVGAFNVSLVGGDVGSEYEALLSAEGLLSAARLQCERGEYENVYKLVEAPENMVPALSNPPQKAYFLILLGQSLLEILNTTFESQRRGEILQICYASFSAARDLAQIIENPKITSLALGHLGLLYENEGRRDEALSLTWQALFEGQKCQAPDVLYRWQWQNGRLLSAQGDFSGAIEAYRRAIDSLERIRENLSFDCSPVRQLSFRESVEPVYFEFADLLLKRSVKRLRPEMAEQDLKETLEVMEQLRRAQFQNYFQDECLAVLQTKSMDLADIQDKSAVVYPILFPNRLEILVSFSGSLQQYTVDVSSDELNVAVYAVRKDLENPDSRRYQRKLKKLYHWLVSPYEADMNARGVDTLVFVPDGALRTIPLAALFDGENYLISKFALATSPGLTLTDLRTRDRTDTTVLLGGLEAAEDGFNRLPGVAVELEKIQHIYQKSQVLKDEQFTVANFSDALRQAPFSMVHIASHGRFDSDPHKTFILTSDGRLTMDDLAALVGMGKFRKEPVELLTLSACQTAAGDDRAALGLAGVALKSGARCALATLWSTDDYATSELITAFYRQLKQSDVSKAQALRNAQLELLTSTRYRHPVYWAPFLMIGNWL